MIRQSGSEAFVNYMINASNFKQLKNWRNWRNWINCYCYCYYFFFFLFSISFLYANGCAIFQMKLISRYIDEQMIWIVRYIHLLRPHVIIDTNICSANWIELQIVSWKISKQMDRIFFRWMFQQFCWSSKKQQWNNWNWIYLNWQRY